MNEFPYTFEEFLTHFHAMQYVRNYEHVTRGDELIEIGPEKCTEFNTIRVYDYMQERYQDPDEQRHKTKMLMLMLMFIAEHIGDFDTGDYAVNGSDESGALVSHWLLKAVHHVYTTRSLSDMGHGPAPKEIMALADKFKAEDESANNEIQPTN